MLSMVCILYNLANTSFILPHDVTDKDESEEAPIKFLPGVVDHIVLCFVWSVVVGGASVVGVLVESWVVEDVEWGVCVTRREANFGTSSSLS